MFNEFRNPQKAKILLEAIHKITRHSWHIMEICGGQTHALARYRIEPLLPKEIKLIHGPGCPVCVTPVSIVDTAIQLALKNNVIFTSFGDMLRVPGSRHDLLEIKSRGADIRIVYSPLDALRIASENPGHEIVFFGIGFETTAPIHALTILEAYRKKNQEFFGIDIPIYCTSSHNNYRPRQRMYSKRYSCRRSCMRHYRNIRI